ncbi:hypothetical protein [Streptomyces alanosinicus]|uniref:Uncharacterized protein n=1 Tax=Streptomyces alanosinicus TaxID=68171 RepID=A0A919D7J5_9ACTN|nr:hypothetical protein [Streptomyces alanosinicus]GHE10926.1 hypothetical protein GCM10010339_68680 [Streptomyces alanosinicus]
MRLVASLCYEDVALSVYVKVKGLGLRPEGCQAKSVTIASYLGMSVASVERGMTQLRRPAPDGVVELISTRRTQPGGRGLSALRSVRTMPRSEAFVWVPVAAAEDLTPRQLRAYALIAHAQQRRIALTEAELADGLRHHTGKKAGMPLSVTAASAVVNEVEAAGWLTVQRRAGARGRNLYITHDLAPEARPKAGGTVSSGDAEAAVDGEGELASSQVDEGSGALDREGSLAYKESPRTDSPEYTRAPISPAAGELPEDKAAGPVEDPAPGDAQHPVDEGDLALHAGGKPQPLPSKPDTRSSSARRSLSAPYNGPQLTISSQIYSVLEPVHVLLKQVHNDFVVRKIAREVGRQMREGAMPEQLQHRLTARFARVMLSDIRDPGRWLLGVALPRWGCGHHDCEAGILWSTGKNCEICAEIVQDKAAAQQRAQHLAKGLCPEHGTTPGPTGRCVDCLPEDMIRQPSPVTVRRTPEGPPRSRCSDCGARIMLVGRALEDELCKLCREESAAPAEGRTPLVPAVSTENVTCSGLDGGLPCSRQALPTRSVCARHRVQELAGTVA